MPVHFVEFREGFWIARREVTYAQYRRFDEDHGKDRGRADDKVVAVVQVQLDLGCLFTNGNTCHLSYLRCTLRAARHRSKVSGTWG